jgi:peptide-methionine (R)-S-oxide reductase
MSDKAPTTDEEWKEKLTPEQYHVTREKGTEEPFSGKYWNVFENGIYTCVCCGEELFRSDQKYDSGCGWPSFFDAIDSDRIMRKEDLSHNMRRIEILCKNCGAHLGHVFSDGPDPTGERYCVNSVSIDLIKKAEEDAAASPDGGEAS